MSHWPIGRSLWLLALITLVVRGTFVACSVPSLDSDPDGYREIAVIEKGRKRNLAENLPEWFKSLRLPKD